MSLPRFGVERPVPVNILMIVLIVAGIGAGLTLTREFFPDTTPKSAQVALPYPGATPEEIEETLARKVEDKLADLDEVERIVTTISEGGGGMIVEFRDGVNARLATDEVERAIATLQDLPDEAEEIRVAEFEPVLPVIQVSVYGEIDEEALKRIVRAMSDELKALPDMGEVLLSGVRDYEIRVDADADALVQHDLSLPEVAAAIDAWMSDVPGGTVRTGEGNVNVRAVGIEERAAEIAAIVVAADAAGGAIRLGDIAQVRETYVDDQVRTRFVGGEGAGPSGNLTIYKVGDQDAVRMAEMVRAYVAGRRAAAGLPGGEWTPTVGERLRETAGLAPSDRRRAYDAGLRSPVPLPPGASVATSSDLARFIEGRLDLLLRNAKAGAVLVFLTLLVFLNWRSAFWVGAGLVTALAGTLLFMQLAGVTLNLLTMFGLIIVIGLLVDDAIVVAENIQSRYESGGGAISAAISGAEQVFWPVVATVITTVVAFLPLKFIKGQIGDLLGALPYVVACALAMSLIESLVILPSHMGHSLLVRDRRPGGRVAQLGRRVEQLRDRILNDRVIPAYAAVLRACLRYRYILLCFSLATLMTSLGMVAGSRVVFEFLPASDSETIIAELRMPIGTPIEETETVVRRIEAAARAQAEFRSANVIVGAKVGVDDTSGVTGGGSGTHLGQVFVELLPVEARDRQSKEVIAAIRDAIGPVEGAENLGFSEIQGGPAGKAITLEITGDDEESTRRVAAEAEALLASVEGVFDVGDDDNRGQREVRIALRPGAAALGLTTRDVARQVRGALFGIDAHVFSAQREDIDVRVRLDERSRRSLDRIENLWIALPGGGHAPLGEIADLQEAQSYATIRRVDRRRAITVTADVAPGLSAESVTQSIAPDLERLALAHPDVEIRPGGRQRQMQKAFESLPVGFLTAMALIYVTLAWLFGSYVQPLAVMLAIPFALIGVVWGHFVMGYNLTFLSLIGFVALSGIVVNDSLILVQFLNEERRRGTPLMEALIASGRQRLRPILLTTITTVLGLLPLMLEQSFQARFLIPMAIAISFGLMSATLLILVLLPGVLLIFDDLRRLARWAWFGRAEPAAAPTAIDPAEA